ncbi:hypothetical protein CI789_12025 [Erwinia persicina]|uniref:hypothetical protein n=1 Tax=Erwinia persicina TaxID=55211 RepID=UPI000E543C4E|nr:hypothetical protein [Erwinia persicina]AXU95898.1 hypothetical protein CI789_12025 [Erwinia persicina]
MELVTKVRKLMKSLIGGKKNLTTGREVDIFVESSFDFSMDSITFGTQRQVGNFTIQYVVSPNPEVGNTAPSITYDQIISNFDANKALAFKDANLILISYAYTQSDVVTDHVSGTVSIAFSINIQVTEKTR